MKAPSVKTVRCAIYTRVSTEHGLDQEFNSLDAAACCRGMRPNRTAPSDLGTSGPLLPTDLLKAEGKDRSASKSNTTRLLEQAVSGADGLWRGGRVNAGFHQNAPAALRELLRGGAK